MIMAVVKAVHGHEGEVTGLVQGTQVQGVEVQSGSDATLLLGIEGLAVEQVELEDSGRVVHVRTDDESAAACPACGVFSTSIKGRAITHPRDLPYGEAPLALVWHKRRWRCRIQAARVDGPPRRGDLTAGDRRGRCWQRNTKLLMGMIFIC